MKLSVVVVEFLFEGFDLLVDEVVELLFFLDDIFIFFIQLFLFLKIMLQWSFGLI